MEGSYKLPVRFGMLFVLCGCSRQTDPSSSSIPFASSSRARFRRVVFFTLRFGASSSDTEESDSPYFGAVEVD